MAEAQPASQPTGNPESSNAKPNGRMALLTTLAQSSNKWVQLGTLLLIALSGIGNWIATWNSSDRNKTEIEISRRVNWESNEKVRQEVIRQVKEIHDWIQDARTSFERGNSDSAENRKMLSHLSRDIDDIQRRLNKLAPSP